MTKMKKNDEVETFATWIVSYAKKHNLQILSYIWDGNQESAGALVVEGAGPGFGPLFGSALVSQDDLLNYIVQSAVMLAAGVYRQNVETTDPPTEQ